MKTRRMQVEPASAFNDRKLISAVPLPTGSVFGELGRGIRSLESGGEHIRGSHSGAGAEKKHIL